MSINFPENLEEARKYQLDLTKKIIYEDQFTEIKTVGALDVAYKSGFAYTAAIVYQIEEKEVIEGITIKSKVKVPYIPTFLFLREVPFFIEIFKKIKSKPDIFLIDGHGLAHPYLSGSATVFGILTDKPSIGVAKKPLRYFKYESIDNRTDFIILKEKKVGIRYRVKKQWNPIFISPGTKISIETSFHLVKNLLVPKFKLPVPSHLAHKKAEEAKNVL